MVIYFVGVGHSANTFLEATSINQDMFCSVSKIQFCQPTSSSYAKQRTMHAVVWSCCRNANIFSIVRSKEIYFQLCDCIFTNPKHVDVSIPQKSRIRALSYFPQVRGHPKQRQLQNYAKKQAILTRCDYWCVLNS